MSDRMSVYERMQRVRNAKAEKKTALSSEQDSREHDTYRQAPEHREEPEMAPEQANPPPYVSAVPNYSRDPGYRPWTAPSTGSYPPWSHPPHSGYAQSGSLPGFYPGIQPSQPHRDFSEPPIRSDVPVRSFGDVLTSAVSRTGVYVGVAATAYCASRIWDYWNRGDDSTPPKSIAPPTTDNVPEAEEIKAREPIPAEKLVNDGSNDSPAARSQYGPMVLSNRFPDVLRP